MKARFAIARALFRGALLALTAAVVWAMPDLASADDLAKVSVSFPDEMTPEQAVPALKILGLLTIVTLAPALLISVTSFTRIIVVLNFAKQALGTQSVPPAQVVVSLALMLTAVVMAPVAHNLNEQALDPYIEEEISESVLYERSRIILSQFLLRQTREADLMLFYDLSGMEAPAGEDDVAIHLLVPAFMISELRTGFEMGFLLFLPFVLVDLVAGAVLTSMGMVMLPPTMISTPLKVLIFVVVDGWSLLVRSLVSSFA